jgi:hypothetical protein
VGLYAASAAFASNTSSLLATCGGHDFRRTCLSIDSLSMKSHNSVWRYTGLKGCAVSALKVISADTMLPPAVASIHSLLMELGDGEGE